MGSSYAALTELCENILDSNMISKALPANLAFVALIGHGMLDRYPDLRIGFLEFGGEWIFYMSGRLKHYAALNRRRMPNSKGILQRDVDDYLNQAEFLSPRRRMMPCWFKRWRSWVRIRSCSPRTFPNDEGRGDAMREVLDRHDISAGQKRKILCDNTLRFFGPL